MATTPDAQGYDPNNPYPLGFYTTGSQNPADPYAGYDPTGQNGGNSGVTGGTDATKSQPVPTTPYTPSTPSPQTPTGPSNDLIKNAYETYLGRDPGTQGGDLAAETAWEAGDPNWLQTIQNSPEAQLYKQNHATGPSVYTPLPASATQTPTPAPSNAPANNSPFLQSLQQALTSQIGTLSDPNQAGANSPWVQPAIQANHLATQRGLQDTNNQLAEAAYASGVNPSQSGSLATAQQRAAENAAANEANFTGQAVQNQSGLNMSALMNLLGIGGGQLSSANNTLTQQQALANQFQLGNNGLGLGYSQLTNANQQGNNQLGLNYAQLIALLNSQAYNAAAGGA